MADSKISALPASTTPLAGTEVLPIVQSSATKQVSVANLTAGRAISATQLTLTAGNLIVASGQGIDFSATPGTGTSELLDDYEEGTFTATANPASGSITFVAGVNGSYTKIGGCVTCLIDVEVSAVSTPSGRLRIENLPFAATSRPSVFFISMVDGNIGYGNAIRGDIQLTATFIFADRMIDTVQTLDVAAACKVGTRINSSFSYFVA
jgi:hypothetical protein